MRRPYRILTAILVFGMSVSVWCLTPVTAEDGDKNGRTLLSVLVDAYRNSPTLRAERTALRSQYENVAQAEAHWRPSVDVDGGTAFEYADSDPGTDDTNVQKDVGLNVTQPIFRGGRTIAATNQQLRLSDAALADYDDATQNLLLDVVTAIVDVQRDRATIGFTEKNYEFIAKQLDATQAGFEVGELTRTDVSQAKARLAGAEAALVEAKSDYQSSLARFEQFAGFSADSINITDIEALGVVSETLDEARAKALDNHPLIRAAQYQEKAAYDGIGLAEGELLPEINVTGALDQQWDPSALLDEAQAASLGLRATLPLYEGGAMRSRIRQAKMDRYERLDRIDAVKREIRQRVTTAWNNYKAALSQTQSFEKQVEAATVARTGVYKEREVGLRTVIDTLDADAELLNAEVGLAGAQRDTIVARYTLMAAIGDMTARALDLDNLTTTQEKELNEVRENLFGTDIQEE